MQGWEIGATLLVLAISLAPIVRCLGTRRRVTAVLIISVAAFAWATTRLRSSPREEPEGNEALPRQVAKREFISSASCRACHPGEYASWHQTFHRTMTQLPTPDAVRAPFENVQLTLNGQSYGLSREGDEFWIELPDPEQETLLLSQGRELATAEEVRTVRRRIVLVTGSHHFQNYWVTSGDGKGLYHVPWEYHITEKRWMPSQDAHLAPPNEPRSVTHWNSNCIACHAVNGIPGWNQMIDHWSTEVAEFGIACEACHGPGEQHVRRHRNPLIRYRQHGHSGPDPTIVNPARLSSKKSTSICGQCHSTFHTINESGTPDLLSFLRHGNTYRAGADLAKSVRMLSPHKPGIGIDTAFRQVYFNENDVRGSYWSDGTSRIGGREYLGLLETQCFIKGQMSCLSCHSMHHSNPAGQLATSMRGNQACVQCHAEIGRRVEAHTHHPQGSDGSLCYNCHMPHTSYSLFRAVRAHRVDSPRVTTSLNGGRPNACNLCHLDRTLAWSAQHLSDWHGVEPVSLSSEEREVAASLLWLIRGDAAQRVVTVWHMGWKPAQRVSGPLGWQAPFLATLLQDSYSVVRYMAALSLRSLPHFEGLQFNHIGSSKHIEDVKRQVLDTWKRHWTGRIAKPNPSLLLDDGAVILERRLQHLLEQRDQSPLRFKE